MDDTSQPEIGVAAGDVLAGKYRVERVLGAGGMGVVVAAHHIHLDEKVALKFLLPQALGSAEAVERFLREARAAAKIKSEHVARVSDVGQLETGSPYIVMEYLEGGDLSDWLKQHGPLPVERAVDFVLQACEALAEAHTLGIVHRDLKPANLFRAQRADGSLCIKVLDFGISKFTAPSAAGHDMTRTSSIMGSPTYMSPEQMERSKGVDARTDVWALGIMLYELVTGHPPFEAQTLPELVLKIVNEPTPSVLSVRPEAPAALDRAIARCLEKQRARRFSSVGELAVALADLGTRHGRISVEAIVGTIRNALNVAPLVSDSRPPSRPPGRAEVGTTLPTGQAPRRARPGSLLFLGVGVVVVAAVLGGAAVAFRASARASGAGSNASPSAGLPSATAPPTTAAPPSAAPGAWPSAPAPGPPSTASATASAARAPARPYRPPVPSHPAPAAPAASASAQPPNCTPPYVIDLKGNHQYKPECL